MLENLRSILTGTAGLSVAAVAAEQFAKELER